MEKASRTQAIFDWPRCKRLRPLLHRPVHRQPPRGEEGEGGRGAAGRGREGRGRRDGAAAGVFQIITSSCGGGGLPW